MDLCLFAAALLILSFPKICRACTTVIVGRNASPTGHVIVGHNEDDSGCLLNRHGFVPAAVHTESETLPAENGLAAIPQAARTHGFYWSEYKGANGGPSSADCFYNDHGVLVISDSCADSKEDTSDASRLNGGISYNLRRIVAERADSAAGAADIAAELVARYGYAPSGRSYVFADADEAWVFQVVSGHHYAAQRVGDDEAAFIPNYYTIHGIDLGDKKRFRASPGLIEHAQERGWYDPQGDFDFAAAYQSDKTRFSEGNRARSAGGYSMLLRRPYFRDGDYPFAVRPPAPVPPEQVMEVLRSHYEGTAADPAYLRAPFPGGAPHYTDVRRICTGTTLDSCVAVFGPRERPDLTCLWLSPGRPCELPYIPIHPFFGVPRALDMMGKDAPALLESHLSPETGLLDRRESNSFKLRDFQNMFELVYEEQHERHDWWLRAYEAALAARERELQEKMADTDAETAGKLARAQDQEQALHTVLMIGELKKDLSPLTVIAAHRPTDGADLTELIFTLNDRVPMDGTIEVTMGCAYSKTARLRPLPGSMKRHSMGWSVLVETGKLDFAGVPGFFDYWLGGRDTKGRPFGGQFFFRVK